MLQATHDSYINTEQLKIRGLVQGVGFRPTVYRLAQEMKLKGEVFNDGEGVCVILVANIEDIDTFIQELQQQCPPLARIEKIQRTPATTDTEYQAFIISPSQHSSVETAVVADAATCPACLDEINDAKNRRSGYAFTNCTHCGPRLSIVHSIPYDRTNTSMAEFKLCSSCQQEYDNPLDRRFHAQPNACPDCGPVLQLTNNLGDIQACEDIIATTAQYLKQGKIVAIKGIGGFQLACDASNESAVKELRHRKHRPHKSLALMAANIDQIKKYCEVSSVEQSALESHQAPIVILKCNRTRSVLSAQIAPDQNTLGFMLPYSPLHHLLMQQLDAPIVLTSGNLSEEPQCIDNQQAIQRLGQIADYLILHNRDIVNRIDDSVIRFIESLPLYYRRARGYAPAPLPLADEFNTQKNILACGGEMKNTFCLMKNNQAILSQHMGNLENTLTYEDYLKNLDLYQRLFQFKPDVIVIDKHPEYLSGKYGEQLAAEQNLPLLKVQHHHAHIASCLLDNQWSLQQGKVIAVALDGLGFGDDDSIWGGEFMLADYLDYQRLARFKPVPMPGATKAILEPWRNTYAQLYTHCDWLDLSHRYSGLDLFQYLQQQPLDLINRMMENNLNSPLTSSCGRLFDAVAAALGLQRERISFEGQAAITLEALIDPQEMDTLTAYPFELEQHNELVEINPAPMWMALLHDLQMNKSLSHISARFHLCVAQIISQTVSHISTQCGIKTVALSGGVFQNTTLLQRTLKILHSKDFHVLTHQRVPSNDGGLALGQASIANAGMQAGLA